MADNRSISGSITTEADGPSRVALDLAFRIANVETDHKKDREYWLRLYSQCKRVVDLPAHIDDIVGMVPKKG